MSDDSWTLPYTPLSLADYNQYPFSVINHNHEHMTFLSSVRLLSKWLSLRVALGPPELCNPKSRTPALTHLARTPMGSSKYLHPKPWGHSILILIPVNSCLLSHPMLRTVSFYHWPLQASLPHSQTVSSHSSSYLSSYRNISLFCITTFFCQAHISGS